MRLWLLNRRLVWLIGNRERKEESFWPSKYRNWVIGNSLAI